MRHWITRSLLLMLVALLVIPFLFAGCGAGEVTEGVYEVRISSQMPVGHHITEAVDLLCERAEELSDGRLEFHHFPSGQLLQDMEVPESISTGTIEMAQTYFAWWIGLCPDLNLYGGVFLDDLDHYYRVYEGPLGDYQKELLEGVGAKVIAPILYTAEAGYIFTKPVHEPSDAEGMKIRTPSAAAKAEIEAMGAAAVVMSSADVYMALQQGTIDGALSGVTSFYARKFYEVAKYVLIFDLVTADFHIVANLDWWNSLPEDLQQDIMQAGEEATEYATEECLASEEAARAALEAEGVEIYRVPQDEREQVWQPLKGPVRHDTAVDTFGEELVDQYETWVEEAREE